MKDFEAIRALWKVQKEVPMSYDDIIKNISANHRNYAMKLISQSIGIAIAIIAVLSIWFFKSFFTWTTHLSMFILCFCMIYYFIIQVKDYQQIRKFDRHLLKPQDFIAYLKHYEQESCILNIKNFKIYTWGIGIAFLFILFEMYFMLPLLLLIIFALATLGWFLYSYFFLMKTYIKKE